MRNFWLGTTQPGLEAVDCFICKQESMILKIWALQPIRACMILRSHCGAFGVLVLAKISHKASLCCLGQNLRVKGRARIAATRLYVHLYWIVYCTVLHLNVIKPGFRGDVDCPGSSFELSTRHKLFYLNRDSSTHDIGRLNSYLSPSEQNLKKKADRKKHGLQSRIFDMAVGPTNYLRLTP